MKQKHLHWDNQEPPTCACGGTLEPYHVALKKNRGIIDDQIEGGARFFETMGHEPVWIESKSEWRREMDKRQLENVVRHDADYYKKRFKEHDERLRDTGEIRH